MEGRMDRIDMTEGQKAIYEELKKNLYESRNEADYKLFEESRTLLHIFIALYLLDLLDKENKHRNIVTEFRQILEDTSILNFMLDKY
jgi:hypothetical protein